MKSTKNTDVLSLERIDPISSIRQINKWYTFFFSLLFVFVTVPLFGIYPLKDQLTKTMFGIFILFSFSMAIQITNIIHSEIKNPVFNNKIVFYLLSLFLPIILSLISFGMSFLVCKIDTDGNIHQNIFYWLISSVVISSVYGISLRLLVLRKIKMPSREAYKALRKHPTQGVCNDSASSSCCYLYLLYLIAFLASVSIFMTGCKPLFNAVSKVSTIVSLVLVVLYLILSTILFIRDIKRKIFVDKYYAVFYLLVVPVLVMIYSFLMSLIQINHKEDGTYYSYYPITIISLLPMYLYLAKNPLFRYS